MEEIQGTSLVIKRDIHELKLNWCNGKISEPLTICIKQISRVECDVSGPPKPLHQQINEMMPTTNPKSWESLATTTHPPHQKNKKQIE